jgi:hypothetical protein
VAAMLTMWQQDAFFDPTNPNQIQRTYYAQVPGRYASFYYSKIPSTATLQGLGDTTLPDWLTTAIVGLVGLGVGYFGWKAAGPSVKKKLHLSGHRRRR